MFAYCNNSPVILADKHGSDACIVINDDSAAGFGHVGFLVDDEEGNWWHFYWGPKYVIISIFAISVEPISWLEKYEGDITLDSINASGQYSGTYDRMIYLEGDFSDCMDSINSIDGAYNLLSKNCSQVSLLILSAADSDYQDQITYAAQEFIRPDHAFDYLENVCITPTSSNAGKGGYINTVHMFH